MTPLRGTRGDPRGGKTTASSLLWLPHPWLARAAIDGLRLFPRPFELSGLQCLRSAYPMGKAPCEGYMTALRSVRCPRVGSLNSSSARQLQHSSHLRVSRSRSHFSPVPGRLSGDSAAHTAALSHGKPLEGYMTPLGGAQGAPRGGTTIASYLSLPLLVRDASRGLHLSSSPMPLPGLRSLHSPSASVQCPSEGYMTPLHCARSPREGSLTFAPAL